jgi:mRNA-degrading endonuclease toxin of MazEF toxin-antitoxin module
MSIAEGDDDRSFTRSDVVWAPAQFKTQTTERPYLVVSTDAHPFHGEEYVALGITTRRRAEALSLDGEWEKGGTPEPSYVNPWSLVTIKHGSITDGQGRVREEFVERAVAVTAFRYLGVPE